MVIGQHGSSEKVELYQLVYEVLSTGLHTGTLHTKNSFVRGFTSKERIRSKPFPVSPTLCLHAYVNTLRQLKNGYSQHTTRPRFIIGPKAMLTPLPLCSWPIATPRWRMRERCHVEAALIPAGKTVAKSVSRTPRGESYN